MSGLPASRGVNNSGGNKRDADNGMLKRIAGRSGKLCKGWQPGGVAGLPA